MSNALNPHFEADYRLLPPCDKRRESEYNESVAIANNDAICLDGKNISPVGQYQVEPCDILIKTGNEIHLVHVKISTRSSSLRHLLNQGVNSVELIRTVAESKEKIKELTGNNRELNEIIDAENLKVVYGIITGKADANPENRSKNLPIFSRISLMRVLNDFSVMKIPCSICLIKDEFNRKGIEE